MKCKIFRPNESPIISDNSGQNDFNSHFSKLNCNKREETRNNVKTRKDHFLLGEGCAKSSAWKHKQSGAALFFLFSTQNEQATRPFFALILMILALIAAPAARAGWIMLEKDSYGLEETIPINLALS